MTRGRLRRAFTAATLAGVVAVPTGGCVRDQTEDVVAYEDCDEGDQGPPPGYPGREADCGFWMRNGVASNVRLDDTWLWIWYPWVSLGYRSYPSPGWKPPRGVTVPTRVITVPKGKTRPCARGAATDVAVVSLAPPPPPPPMRPPPPPPPQIRPNPPRPPGQPPARPNPPPPPPPPPPARRGC